GEAGPRGGPRRQQDRGLPAPPDLDPLRRAGLPPRATRTEERMRTRAEARIRRGRAAVLGLGLVLAISGIAEARVLRWKSLDVKARLDAAGNLHVVETHDMIFDGDWNRAEPTVR